MKKGVLFGVTVLGMLMTGIHVHAKEVTMEDIVKANAFDSILEKHGNILVEAT